MVAVKSQTDKVAAQRNDGPNIRFTQNSRPGRPAAPQFPSGIAGLSAFTNPLSPGRVVGPAGLDGGIE